MALLTLELALYNVSSENKTRRAVPCLAGTSVKLNDVPGQVYSSLS